jgi:hypothetical protein
MTHVQKVTKPRGDAFVQKIFDATLTELAQVGYAKLSIPDIALRSGANKTSIYRRWPDVTALLQEAVASVMIESVSIPDTGSLKTDLFKLAKASASFMQSPLGKTVVQIMFTESSNPALKMMAAAAYSQTGRSASDETAHPVGPFVVIQRALIRGEIKSPKKGQQILFTIAGAMMHRIFIEKSPVNDSYLRELIGLVLNGALYDR